VLKKINRIKKKKDFEIIFTRGRGVKDKFLALKFFKNNLIESRFGLVVSKKISQKAVVRNKVRRRLSNIIGSDLDAIKKGTDIVFIALSGAELKSFLETKETVKNILKKANLF